MATTTQTPLPRNAWVEVDTLTSESPLVFLQPTARVVYRVDPIGSETPDVSAGGFEWRPENDPIRLGGGGMTGIVRVRAPEGAAVWVITEPAS